ncbi:MAG TPA: glycosyltransferase family 2 protein [Acidobacteriaceae bacterium]
MDEPRPPRPTLSFAIVAKNEESNLRRVLPTIAWADEIVLVDSGSTDGTLALARQYGARIFHETWKGYGGQCNSALDKCTGDWVFSLDADEALTPELSQVIQALLGRVPEHAAYWVPRRNFFLGQWMRHGGFYPDRKLRLFRRGTARLAEDTEPHATPKYDGPTGVLSAPIVHDAYPTLSLYLDHMERYSTASVPLLVGRGRLSVNLAAFLWNVLLTPLATFFYNYVVRLGVLDGRRGLLLHLYHSCYVSWKYAKAWERGAISARKPE